MGMLTVLVFILGLACAFGSGCTDISGKWENELGSIMRLEVAEDNRLTGEYWTAVESNKGDSEFVTNITGIFSNRKKESLLAFSVLFNHGASLTSWVGQCIMCDDKEILYTTYILRKYVADPKKKWTSLIINQNTFWRTEKDIPTHFLSMDFYMSTMPYSAVTDDNLVGGMPITRKWKSDNEEINISEMTENVPGREIYINGKWKRNTSEDMQIYGMIHRFQKDKHVPIDVNGRDNENNLAVALVGKINERVRSWTGHISGEPTGVRKSLETSWLEHEFNPSCSEPRAHVRFGMEKYTEVTFDNVHTLKEPETFLEKIRRFFNSMF